MKDSYRLFDPAPAPAAAPLFWRSEMPQHIIAAHDTCHDQPPVDLLVVRNAVYGGRGVLARDGAMVFDPPVGPKYLQNLLESPGIAENIRLMMRGALLSEQREIIASPVPAIIPIHSNWIFGHFVLEILPRALLLDRTCPPDWPVLVSTSGPRWMSRLMAKVLPRRRQVRFDGATQVVSAPYFVGCSDLLLPDAGNVETVEMIRLFKAQCLAWTGYFDTGPTSMFPYGSRDRPDRIFVVRPESKPRLRKLVNQAEIAAELERRGYALIRPEEHSFEEQVAIFDAARIIVGEFGSGMHNAMFSRPGTKVVCLNWLTPWQSRIAQFFGHEVGYIAPDGGEFPDTGSVFFGPLRMSFDIPALIARLAEIDPDL